MRLLQKRCPLCELSAGGLGRQHSPRSPTPKATHKYRQYQQALRSLAAAAASWLRAARTGDPQHASEGGGGEEGEGGSYI